MVGVGKELDLPPQDSSLFLFKVLPLPMNFQHLFGPDVAEKIFERAVRRTMQLCERMHAPRIGERVDATVTDLLDEGVTCKVKHNDKVFNGIIVSNNLNATEAKRGARLHRCAVAYVDSDAMLELFVARFLSPKNV